MFRIAWDPNYTLTLPEGHRFPMMKYEMTPRQLLLEEIIERENFFHPAPISEELILRVHDSEYWKKLKTLSLSKDEERVSGFPLSQELIERERTIMMGTVMCADYALEYGCAMNVAGGTHHAYRDRAEGFCLLNDQAIAAQYLLDQKGIKKILILDLDVHQGNGTARIFENEPRVFTFSMHGNNNFPFVKENSDLDIELEDHTDDKQYLNLLEENIKKLLDELEPDFIFFQSGVDVLETDKLGRLSLSIQGCSIRDRIVIENAFRYDIPLVASMGGGYSEDIETIVEAHCNTFRIAEEIFFEE
jgi:acetoin utilization deacetylase AcuC-like enzyme